MNWLDVVILAAMAIATFIGLKIGVVRAVLSLAGLIAGVILAGQYYVPLSQQLSFIHQAGVARAVAFTIILVAVMIVASLLAWLLSWATSVVKLGWVNHLGGAVFGLVLGAILCSAFLAMWVKFVGVEGAIAQSTLARVLLDRFPMVLALLPDEFDVVRSFFP